MKRILGVILLILGIGVFLTWFIFAQVSSGISVQEALMSTLVIILASCAITGFIFLIVWLLLS